MDGNGWPPSSSSSGDPDNQDDTPVSPRSIASILTNPFDDGWSPLDDARPLTDADIQRLVLSSPSSPSETPSFNGPPNGHAPPNVLGGTNGTDGVHGRPRVNEDPPAVTDGNGSPNGVNGMGTPAVPQYSVPLNAPSGPRAMRQGLPNTSVLHLRARGMLPHPHPNDVNEDSRVDNEHNRSTTANGHHDTTSGVNGLSRVPMQEPPGVNRAVNSGKLRATAPPFIPCNGADGLLARLQQDAEDSRVRAPGALHEAAQANLRHGNSAYGSTRAGELGTPVQPAHAQRPVPYCPPHRREHPGFSGVLPATFDLGPGVPFGNRLANPIYDPQAGRPRMERRTPSIQPSRPFRNNGTATHRGSTTSRAPTSTSTSYMLSGGFHYHSHGHPATARLNGGPDVPGSTHGQANRPQGPVPSRNPGNQATLRAAARNTQNGFRHADIPDIFGQSTPSLIRRHSEHSDEEVPDFVARREIATSSELRKRVLDASRNEMSSERDTPAPRRIRADQQVETIRTAEIHLDDDADCMTDAFWEAKPKHDIKVKETTLMDSYNQPLKNQIEVTEVFDFRKSAQATSDDVSDLTDEKRAVTKKLIAAMARETDPLRPRIEIVGREIIDQLEQKRMEAHKKLQDKCTCKEEDTDKKGKGKCNCREKGVDKKDPGQN